MKFNFKYALIAALIVGTVLGMVLGMYMLISCAYNGAWGKFCIAAAFEFVQAFALGGLLDG